MYTLSVWFPIKVQARVCEWERARVLCDDGGWVYRTCSWFGVAFFGKFSCVTMNSSTIKNCACSSKEFKFSPPTLVLREVLVYPYTSAAHVIVKFIAFSAGVDMNLPEV